MPPRGYNDIATVALMKEFERSHPGASRASAIKHVAGEGNERRYYMKMKRDDLFAIEQERKSVVDRHTETFPILFKDNGDVSFMVVWPGAASDGKLTCTGIRCGETGRSGFSLQQTKPEEGPWRAERMAWAASGRGLFEAMALLGLSLVADRGRLAPAATRPVLESLSDALRKAWAAAGCARDGDAAEASALETSRLMSGGLAAVDAALPSDFKRVGGAYGPTAVGLGDPFAEAVKIELLAELASFANPSFIAMGRDDAAMWHGRAPECLVRHLNDFMAPSVDAGRRMDLADASWLVSVFGGKSLAALGSPVIEAMVRWQGRIDPRLAATDADAAGIVELVRHVAQSHGLRKAGAVEDAGLDLLFERLNTGRDANRRYGEVLAALYDLDRDMSQVVRSAVYGAERLCEAAMRDLALPAVVARAAAGGGRSWAKPLRASVGLWGSRLEAAVRDMVFSGREMADLATAVAAFKVAAAPTSRFELDTAMVDKAISEATDEAEVDAAWERLAGLVAPRWRTRGRRMLIDQLGRALSSRG